MFYPHSAAPAPRVPPQSVRIPTMQVVEKSNEGLSRVLEVTIPQKELTDQLDAKIAEVGPRLKIKGFRPGKVPAAHVRKMFAREMMQEIRGRRLLEGFRGAPPADCDALASVLLAVSQLVVVCPEIAELDLNPLVAHAPGLGAVAVDARIRVSG